MKRRLKPFRLFDIKARVDPDFKERIRLAAKQRGLSIGAFVRYCISMVLNQGNGGQAE